MRPPHFILTHKLTHLIFLPGLLVGGSGGQWRLGGHLEVGQGQPNMLFCNNMMYRYVSDICWKKQGYTYCKRTSVPHFIHRKSAGDTDFKNRMQVQIAVSIKKSYMAWALAMCLIAALSCRGHLYRSRSNLILTTIVLLSSSEPLLNLSIL